ncbi:glycosyl hydrolase [Tenacibaculum sp. UWU-22]|uniref:VPS10 domain-containing protein n=1 Tax=Tenacibaculum sp. UWU-22 TaxID=3234187 RepID=UPI0034DAC3C4
MKSIIKLALFFLPIIVFSQQLPTSSKAVQEAVAKKAVMSKNSLVKNVALTNIGPTVMSGRVVDVAVNPNNTIEFYVAYASGGLWYTNNNGTTFTPVLDNAATQNIGDIAVDWKTGTLWVGTGENNSSRSSYAGIGILKSTDKGKTWLSVGLFDSHHIGRILINPDNPEEVIVGVLGHLYSPNAERGIYKTTDGGKTWKKTLYIDENTGIIDVQPAPNNFNVLYAASWQRIRKAWNFDGSGSNSAIYKSIDGGDSWVKISDNNGFVNGKGVGRIGLAVFDENTVYALLDNQFKRKQQKRKKRKKIKKTSKKQQKEDEEKETDASVIGAEVYRTDDGGKLWHKTNLSYLNLYSSYGYYFGEIRVDPQNKNAIYILGVSIMKSKDGGKTFTSISRENVHADHHALWIDPKKQGHLINGNDGGLNLSYDDGESWFLLNQPPVGQFYSVFVDNQEPYNVYGGLQDNGVWVAKNNAKINKQWQQSGKNPYQKLLGADGMQVVVDSRDPTIVYAGYQYGSYYRIDRKSEEKKSIRPKSTSKKSSYRFNWQTPIQLSKHNQDIVYLGSNKLHRSLNRGDDWETISDDLTQGAKKGNVVYGTLTTISESPFQSGLIYVGSDDGLVHVTKNTGGSWETISNTLPQNLWVTRVIASAHKKERVYVTLNGYRYDDFTPYIYLSDNYGVTWKNIGSTLPMGAVNVIKEDPENENVLYVGTDNGLYVTFDKGNSWQVFNKNFPQVAVHDLAIQPTEKELVVATHGRSLYKVNIAPLQKLTADLTQQAVHIFEIKSIKKRDSWGQSAKSDEPKISIPFYSDSATEVTAAIFSGSIKVNTFTIKADKGFNEAVYDATFSEEGKKTYEQKNKPVKKANNNRYYLPKGEYTVKINGAKQNFKIK